MLSYRTHAERSIDSKISERAQRLGGLRLNQIERRIQSQIQVTGLSTDPFDDFDEVVQLGKVITHHNGPYREEG